MNKLFDQLDKSGRRAKCIQPECDSSSHYNVMLYSDHAFCFRCKKRWWNEEQKPKTVSEPVQLKNTKRVKPSKILKESNYDEARSNFLNHFDTVITELELPWSDVVKEEDYGLGALNNKDSVQLVFKIKEDHIKLHKGKQFGNAECSIYPKHVLSQVQTTSTLLICEGEKDAITANANGAPAITFTSGAGALPKDISSLEKFTNIVICYDNDDVGAIGAVKIAKALFKQNKKRKLRILKWDDKPNKYDITDFFSDQNTANDLYSALDKLELYGTKPAHFGGLKEYDPDAFVNKLQSEVVQICEEILLEQGTSSISGQSNVGKSILAMQFSMCVAMGVPFLTFKVPKPKRVLLVQFEMMDAHIANRIVKTREAMLSQYPSLHAKYKDNLRVTSVDGVKIFTDQYESIEGNLMAADPPSGGANISKNEELTQLMSRIDTLRKEYKCAFMLVSHHKKLEEKRPLEHSMVYGGSYFVNFLDNLIQVANTGRHSQLKVFKITKIRTESRFHEVPLGIFLQTEDDRLYFEYKKPLPKNEIYWYTDPEENTEERVLKALESNGANFDYKQFADALEEVLKITSTRSVYKWLDKFEDMGYIKKIEKGHWIKTPNELEAFLT